MCAMISVVKSILVDIDFSVHLNVLGWYEVTVMLFVWQMMYGYAVKHHSKRAIMEKENYQFLTALTLSSKLGRNEIFKEIIEPQSIVSTVLFLIHTHPHTHTHTHSHTHTSHTPTHPHKHIFSCWQILSYICEADASFGTQMFSGHLWCDVCTYKGSVWDYKLAQACCNYPVT